MAIAMIPTPDVADVVERATTDLRELVGLLGSLNLPSVDLVAAVESVGRLADAARIRVAAPLAGDPTAVEKLGFTSPVAAIATVAQISERTARARAAVATAVTESRSITGTPLPPMFPALGDALDAGQVGADAAAFITNELRAVASRVDSETLAAAEAIVVNLACGLDAAGQESILPVSVDYLAAEVRQVAAAIDPDGARPREERTVRRRGFRVGPQDSDGLFPVSGRLLPEIGGLLNGLLEAHRRSPRFANSDQLIDSAGLAVDGISVSVTTDPRTPDQRRHDALAEIVTAATTAESSPRLDGQPVTVVVTVRAEDLTAEGGRDGDPIGTMTGSRFPVSRREVERFIDANGHRTATFNRDGAFLGIRSPQRCFTPLQRLGVAVRDGQRCFAPGCTSPHFALQAHHVTPDRDGGPTATHNCILLCFWHHLIVDSGPWQYRMRDGVPEVRGPGIPDWCRPRSALPRAA